MTTPLVIIKRGNVTFYIADESIIVANGTFQYSTYNTFMNANKGDFYKFRDAILHSQPPMFSSIVDVVELSSKFAVYGYGSRKPNLEGLEYEYRP